MDSSNITRHTRICSVHFEEGLGPTKLNPVPSVFAFPQHLQRKLPKSRADPEERRRRQRKETPQPSKNKLFTNRKNQDEMNSEQMDHGSKEQYSGFELADISFSEPVYVDAAVQTDLPACDIDIMADCKEKLENKTQLKRDLLAEDDLKKRSDSQVLHWHSITGLLIYDVPLFKTIC